MHRNLFYIIKVQDTLALNYLLIWILKFSCIFSKRKDVVMDNSNMYVQFNSKNSSMTTLSQLLCYIMKFNVKNSPKIEFCFFEVEIWYTWLGLYKNAMMQDFGKIGKDQILKWRHLYTNKETWQSLLQAIVKYIDYCSIEVFDYYLVSQSDLKL